MFRDADEATKSLEGLVGQLERFRRQLGGSALSSTAIDQLLPLAEALNEGAADIIDVVVGLEEKEHFGDEESYWNVLRYFCVDGNIGTVRTLEDLWDHLALTFDMTGETLDTLADTLEDWRGDIETDAKVKYKAPGKFAAMGNGYVFYEDPASAARRETRQRVATRPKAAPVTSVPAIKPPEPAAVELTAEEQNTDERIHALLQDFGKPVKQALIVKAIMDSDRTLTHGDILGRIDAMVADGKIYKFKLMKGGPAHLSLNSQDAVVDAEAPVLVAAPEKAEEEIDFALAYEVLGILAGRGRKPGQMMATSQMINSITPRDNGGIPSISELNRVARQLAAKGLVRTDMGTPLGGKGKAKSRAKSRSVFRVGIPDAERQELVRELLASGRLEL